MNRILVKCIILLLLLNAVVCYSKKYDRAWQKYKSLFGKHYDYEKEETRRREMWEETMNEIKKHNKEYNRGIYKYTLSLNHMSDWTDEERKAHIGCATDPGDTGDSDKAHEWKVDCDERCRSKLPRHVDWREKNVVTRVKDQGNCGSCWAFGVVAGLESQNALHTGELLELSEQDVIDCSVEYGNKGCDGGTQKAALFYIMKNKGINTEGDYPYEAKKGQCRNDPEENKAAIKSYVTVKTDDEELMKAVLAHHGPLIASIHVPHHNKKFSHFDDGVFHDLTCPSHAANHIVAVVGYGVHEGSPYWLVKNSWGEDWGMDGYIRIARNENNTCGIADTPTLMRF